MTEAGTVLPGGTEEDVLSFFSLDSAAQAGKKKGGADYRLPLPAEDAIPPGELREEEFRLRLAVSGSRAGIWDWDLATGRAHYSTGYQRLLGYVGEPFGGEIATFEQHLHPQERDRIREILAEHLANRAPYDFEFRMATRAGGYQWFRNRGQAFWDGAGRAVRMVGTIHEINERRRMIGELTQRERKFRSVIETAASVIVGIAPDHSIFEWNSEAERVLGHSRAEALGRNFLRLVVPPELREETALRISNVLKGEPIRHLEGRALRRGGGASVVLWNISRLLDARDEPMGVIHIGLDITERKEQERELQQSRRLKAVGELAAGVAHEFNNMLTPMLIHVQNVADQLGDRADLQADLLRVDQAIQAAAELVGRIVQMSKPAADKLDAVSLSEIVGETATFLVRTLDHRLRVVTAFEAGLPPGLFNRSGIAQSLINLIVNAKDALVEKIEAEGLDEWHPLIRIETRAVWAKAPHEEAPALFHQFSVTDNGRGMSEEVQQKVFQPFFTTKGPRKGTGLGLASVWSFVDSLRGFIELESRSGAGTTFRVHLPFHPAEEAPAPIPEPPPAAASADGGGYHVLYVEDDDSVAAAIVSALQREGWTVERQPDGRAGLEAVRDAPGRWHLVLTDLNMPHFSGLELIEELRNGAYPGKIAVLSGMVSPESQRRLEELGVAAILNKPTTPRGLVEAVWGILRSTVNYEI